MNPFPDLQGKTAVIIGASSGIGEGCAEQLARSGANVVVVARRRERLEALCTRCREYGVRALAITADITRLDEIQRVYQEAQRAFTALDYVIVSSGVGSVTPLAEIDEEEVENVLRVNLTGAILCILHAFKSMKAQGRGHIVVIGSVITDLVWPGDGLYAATKAGLSRFCIGSRPEFNAYGILLSEVAPGIVATDLAPKTSRLPTTTVEEVADAVLGLLNTNHQKRVILPFWYRWLILLNRLIPGISNRWIAKYTDAT